MQIWRINYVLPTCQQHVSLNKDQIHLFSVYVPHG